MSRPLQIPFSLMFGGLIFGMTAVAHPLEGAIRSLVNTESALDAAELQNAADADMVHEAERLKQTIGAIWSDAMLTPIRLSDIKLNKLGFALEEYNNINHYYQLRTNANIQQTQQDAFAMIPDRWMELQKIAGDQAASVRQIGAMITKSEFTDGIAEPNKNAVASESGATRLDGLQSIQSRAAKTLSCIRYFSAAFSANGLVPIADPNGAAAWSDRDLIRLYGTKDLSLLTADQRTDIQLKLKGLIKKTAEYERACISIPTAAFFQNELTKLEGMNP